MVIFLIRRKSKISPKKKNRENETTIERVNNENIDSNVFKFNGFYGKYQGKIVVRNKEYDFEFYHSKSNKDPIKIYL